METSVFSADNNDISEQDVYLKKLIDATTDMNSTKQSLNNAKSILAKKTTLLKNAEYAYFNTTKDDDFVMVSILKKQYEFADKESYEAYNIYEQADNDFYNACTEYEYAENIYEKLCDIQKKSK